MAIKGWMALAPLMLAGCWASPESFLQENERQNCRYLRKCFRADWVASGYANIADCVDDAAPQSRLDAFADACDDYDQDAAADCISGKKKAVRTCDIDSPDEHDREACEEVCGMSDEED